MWCQRLSAQACGTHQVQQVIEKIIVEDLGGSIGNRNGESLNQDPVLGVSYGGLSKLVNRILLMIRTEYAQNITLKSVAERFR